MTNVYGFDPAAWSIDGARHRGELLRLLAYGATGGAEGIVSPGDCRVHALTTPGPQVAIDAGGLLIRNRSANVKNQTYVANGRTETRLDVTPTGSAGGRTDLVIVRIEDPQYSPWQQPSAGEAPDYRYVKPFIVENVPAGTRTAAELNLGYSAVALARLDIPTQTSTITSSHIKELRQLARPREVSRHANVDGLNIDHQVTGGFRQFSPFVPEFDFPEWCTHATVKFTLASSINYSGETVGYFRARLGGASGKAVVLGPHINWDENEPVDANGRRHLYIVPGFGLDVRHLAGTRQPVALWAETYSGYISMRGWGTMMAEVTFHEYVV